MNSIKERLKSRLEGQKRELLVDQVAKLKSSVEGLEEWPFDFYTEEDIEGLGAALYVLNTVRQRLASR